MFKTYASAATGGMVGTMTAPSSGSGATGPGGWHPTILYMLGLVVAEIVAVAMLSRYLLK